MPTQGFLSEKQTVDFETKLLGLGKKQALNYQPDNLEQFVIIFSLELDFQRMSKESLPWNILRSQTTISKTLRCVWF